MATNLGKVSFSFSKITKKPSFKVQPTETVKKVDKIEFIESIEDNSVQVINAGESEEKKPLVIPLQHPNLLIQSVIDAVKSRTDENVDDSYKEDKANEDEIKREENGNEPEKREQTKQETLDEMAARELVEDATQQLTKKPESSSFVVPLASQDYDKQESTLDDYENIPVNDFGLAMLRGMGWDPKKGIGKNGKIVKVSGPALRPKGLGLGADKAVSAQKPVGKNVNEREVLGKGSKVRVTFGQFKNLYGTVEGFDDDAGRISVFMAISSERVSMNGCFVQLVTPDEFSKYSKVLNINAYNNFKDKESGKTAVKELDRDTNNRSETNRNGRTNSPANTKSSYPKESQQGSSYSKHEKSKTYDSDGRDSKRDSSTSKRDKKYSKKYDSNSDSESYKRDKSSKSLSSKGRRHSKHYDSDDDRKYSKSRSKYESSSSKHSKKYSSDSDSEPDEKHKSKSRSKDSKRDKERRRSTSSNSDDHERRRRKHKKNKKKRNRSRSRSGR